MRVSIVPSQILLPQSSVKLGRFITNVEYPHQHHHDPPLDTQPNTLASTRSAYTGEHHAACDVSFRSTLTSLISARFSKSTKLKVRVTTGQFRTYTLDNSEAWFDEATRLPATRAWIERAIDRGDDVYLIVGIHTVTDASINHESAAGRGTGAHAEIPVSLSLTAAGVVAPLGGIVDPSVGFQRRGLDGAHIRFVAPGEHVCAIEYRKLRHEWLSSKRIEKSRLSNVRQWSSMERARDEEDGEDDIIDVGLEDVDGLNGDWDKQIVEGEILFIRSFQET
ncbi:hypothetical protein HIM_10684 [Hirsutella minnesotensis 3608]|uniref:Uncharacterized protein n=1 Tax=Hirsutella minnesotensis 3608 TaxID=1043627 RepID=A0A0F7ZRN6_9HYPO|nr:hypothetical protein HIM_10684 [Hirsutella minnesotensis 3608]